MTIEEFKELVKEDYPKCWYVKGAELYYVRIRPFYYNSSGIEEFGYYQIFDLMNNVLDTFPRRPTKDSGEKLSNLFSSKVEALEQQIKVLEIKLAQAKEEKFEIINQAVGRMGLAHD